MTHWDMEGDLRSILAVIEDKRKNNPDTPYCFQISIDAVPDGVEMAMMKGTVEELKRDIIREMRENGQIEEVL